ncbi:TlpA family protein disulfide reductase [Halobacillus shinanisalinarum]|uniref:TlpA family protein disulfide reductase n=1 Tax=Halobacillus shinanisalinarum TaxID=2932258 RepID=A0ABY4H1D7_9BACI|nr:TlpA family protein disulfide reductase [Halobacillus shinanisalinarum]UOQ93993.1 TlpA family protein disulfide reductase [Halobacillus shinanisalinarum]
MLRKIIRITSLIAILAGFTYVAINLGQNSTAAEIGDPAPDFTLEDMDGNMVSLSDYQGQFVVLNFFASWCPPCREEAPELQDFEEQYGDQAKLLFLDRAEPKVSVQEHIEEFNSTSTYLLDYNDSMAKPYGVRGQPETFFIDEKGVIRYHHVGPMTTEFVVETVNKYRKTPLK